MSQQVYRVEVDDGGTIMWYNPKTNTLHNESGPAIVWLNGSKEYWINGKLHNESGPAIMRPDGYKVYYIHGELHNEFGPAIVRSDGSKAYYLHDKKLTESEFLARNKTSCEDKTIVVDGHTYRLVKAD